MDIYTTVSGDTWDKIALAVYGNEKYADYLMANNYEALEYMIFPPGIEIKCPELTDDVDEDLPFWRN